MKSFFSILGLVIIVSLSSEAAILTNQTTSPTGVSNIVGRILSGPVTYIGTNNSSFTTVVIIRSGKTNGVISDVEFVSAQTNGTPNFTYGGVHLTIEGANGGRMGLYTRQQSGLTSDLVTLDSIGNIIVKTNVYLMSTNGPLITSGNGSPESAITANIGSFFLRTDGGANTTLYIKESGTGNTGWIAK